MAMQLMAGLTGKMLIRSMLFEVVGGIEDKEDHDFLETLLVVHPHLGVGVLIREVSKVPSSLP